MILKRAVRKMIGRFVGKYGYKLVYARPRKGMSSSERVVYRAFCQGKPFYCFKDSIVGEYMLTGQGWDPLMHKFIGDSVRVCEGGVVIEVGANVGASLIPVCSEFPNTTFHMIEPIPQFFELLKKNKESFNASNALLYNVAVSDVPDRVLKIQCDQGNAGALVMEGVIIDIVTVKTDTLDRMFRDAKIAFVKIDVDGYEINVLRGAQELLKRNKPHVFMEFHLGIMKKIGVDPCELLDIFSDAGLVCFDIYDNMGKFIETTKLKQRVVTVAGDMPEYYYVDILAHPDR